MAEERDEVPRSSKNLRERISVSKKWLKNPLNMALLLWILVVSISGAILFMVMTGMLNTVLPKKSQREVWFEVNNQILNAMFTLMCLYRHPKRFYHLVLLCRWKETDVTTLRKEYCEKGTCKPNERIHMIVVVLLLHLNCFAQYGLCSLNLAFRRTDRPPLGVAICIAVAIVAPAAAGLYTNLSPLGKDYESQGDVEQGSVSHLERRYSFASADENDLEWSGGVLDIWDDVPLTCRSLFCTFFVFGWNMERMGLGNMYVHTATFILFCLAPFFIFNLAAVNIDNEIMREGLGYTGIVLCLFGLLYGGFWRIQMRKRFKLPGYNFCCHRPAIADCTLWLFCCWCSLAQEVRTADSYEIVEDGLFKRRVVEGEVSSLPEKKTTTMASSSGEQKDRSDEVLTPPSPPFIHRES